MRIRVGEIGLEIASARVLLTEAFAAGLDLIGLHFQLLGHSGIHSLTSNRSRSTSFRGETRPESPHCVPLIPHQNLEVNRPFGGVLGAGPSSLKEFPAVKNHRFGLRELLFPCTPQEHWACVKLAGCPPESNSGKAVTRIRITSSPGWPAAFPSLPN